MEIRLNGKNIDISSKTCTIQDLLNEYQLENRIVIVEVNKEIIYKEQYSLTRLSNGDSVELIHFVGGG
ncbi:sulfur carrier protein ThiS [Bacillus sp. AFS088145]|uniref:sulfur carrier protein ThiS n=1 Tax=Bacillus sp. AFS088145 TaxID=2033514 RepID=UPI000BF30172|nr:sulfur carrier protein ThiS [Bacillus sp. AFS088145]PFH89039.1 thiamine biosynthesis protein ThiS [Bacillus sp. AFS088145]